MTAKMVELSINKPVLLSGKVWRVAGWYSSGLVELKNTIYPFNNSTRHWTDRMYTAVDSITDLNGNFFNFEYEGK